MRKIIVNIILLIIVSSQILSCQTLRETAVKEDNNFIPYLLPIETEEALYKEIKPILSESVLLGIRFEFINEGVINVYLNVFRNGYDRDHSLTNRKVFINDTFYPLVFDVDDTFYAVTQQGMPTWNVSRADPENRRKDIITNEKIPSLEERKKLRAVYQRSNKIKHNTPILQLDVKGDIVNQ